MRGDPELLVWMPLKDEFYCADPLYSVYAASYRQQPEKVKSKRFRI